MVKEGDPERDANPLRRTVYEFSVAQCSKRTVRRFLRKIGFSYKTTDMRYTKKMYICIFL